ncbi:MAG: hypothetical protein NT007_04165 [Candidatus Kapabacteria bacterium]|nr:hypothetical protein [Candidatus Kapabacteria bacterium]
MEDSRAISPEIKGLFNKVREQAHEFTQAFELLAQEKRKFEMHTLFFLDSARSLRTEVETDIDILKKDVLNIVHDIERKTEKTIKIYSDLSTIISLKDELIKLHDVLKVTKNEILAFSEEIKLQNEIDFETAISAFKTKFDKDIEDLAYKIEIRLSMKIKNFESAIFATEQKLIDLEERQLRQSRDFNKDLETVRTNIAKVKYDKKDPIVNSETPLANNFDLGQMQHRINKVDESFRVFAQSLNKFEPENYLEKYKIENEFKSLKKKLVDSEANIIKAASKIQSSFIIAGISIAVAILAIILALTK